MLGNRASVNLDSIIKDALFVEEKYSKDIEEGNYEYALLCDFINSPFILEDEDEVERLEKIEQIGGLVVYRPVFYV